MKKRKLDIEILLKRCDHDLPNVEKAYGESLRDQSVPADLKVDIKNLCENLRSILDYLAHEVREAHCPSADTRERFYFPIFSRKVDFDIMGRRWYPGLDTKSPTLWSYLERVQPFQPGMAWLGQFNKVNNENKHFNLVPQTRTEIERVRVTTVGRGSVIWTPHKVTFGQRVHLGGVPVDPRTQLPVPDPSQKVEHSTWVDFLFDVVDVPVLTLLRQANHGVRKIVVDIEPLL